MSVTGEITNATNATNALQAKTDTVTGSASSNLSSSEFLNLMMKQLQYQDPMAPTDNAEFISQECQFSQLSTTQDISKAMTQNSSISQTLSLVGKDVTLVNPDDTTKTISGQVTEAKFTSSGGAIVVGGKNYSIGSVLSVKDHAATTAAATTTPAATTPAK